MSITTIYAHIYGVSLRATLSAVSAPKRRRMPLPSLTRYRNSTYAKYANFVDEIIL